MNIDIAALLEPVSPDAPCGADLEYDAEFLELQSAASGKPEQQVGDAIVAAEDPDWADVVRRASSLLVRSHDLRAACRLAEALLRTQGIAGFRDGLALVRGYLERYWDALYPRLEADDDYDPAIRANTVASLCHMGRIVNPLREAPLTSSPGQGSISTRTVVVVAGSEPALPGSETNLPNAGEIEAAFMECDFHQLRHASDAANEACELVAAIEAELTRHVGADRSIDMSPLAKALAEARSILNSWMARRNAQEADAGPDASAAAHAVNGIAGADGAKPERASRGPIHSRADVVRGIEELCAYFAQHEPSSPVPILLVRAKRWVTMDFIAVLEDMAPEAAKEAQRLRGTADIT